MKRLQCLILVMLLVLLGSVASFAATVQVNLEDLIKDREHWEGTMNESYAEGQTEFGDGFIHLKPGGIKSAAYTGGTYKDFEMSFKLKITWPEDSGDWGAVFTFRDQSPGVHVWEAGRNSCYGIFYAKSGSEPDNNKNGVISLRRWVNSDGDTGPEPIEAGKDEANGIALDGKEHLYKLVVNDSEEGVHIALYMDEKIIIDVNDTSDKAIKTEGSFTLINHGPRGVLLSAAGASSEASEEIKDSNTNNNTGDSESDTGDNSADTNNNTEGDTGTTGNEADNSDGKSADNGNEDKAAGTPENAVRNDTMGSDLGTGQNNSDDSSDFDSNNSVTKQGNASSGSNTILLVVAIVAVLVAVGEAVYILKLRRK